MNEGTIHENEETVSSEDSLNYISQKVVQTNRPRIESKIGSARSVALVRSLSKQLLGSLSDASKPEDSDIHEEIDSDQEMVNCSAPPDGHGERTNCQSRATPLRFFQSLSNILDDESVEKSLDIFGEMGSVSTRSSTPDAIIFSEARNGNDTGSSDVFNMLMRSLTFDESFHNSLNDWMGSLSDIFADNRNSGVDLVSTDICSLKVKSRPCNDLRHYMQRSISSYNILRNDARGDSLDNRSPRNIEFQRSQSFRNNRVAALRDKDCSYSRNSKCKHFTSTPTEPLRLEMAKNFSTVSLGPGTPSQNATRPARRPSFPE